MRLKKGTITFSMVIVVLLVLIVFIVNNILNKGTKEVSVAKKFIENLSDNNIIEKYKDDSKIVEEATLNKLANKSSQIQYSVIVGNYGVDIDKNYNVLGFSNKNLGSMPINEVIDEKKAINLATKYVNEITDDEFKFKEVRTRQEENSPCYNIIFYKCKDGYPYYKQEISAIIDKSEGKLEGYSNYPLDHIKHIKEINIDEVKAGEIAKGHFTNLNFKVSALDNPMIAFVSVKDDEMVLSYIYNVKVINNDKKEEIYNICIRADSGEVINFNLEAVAMN
ncbi:hypothetical protein NSA50_00445 [Clostridium sp. DSM 100503]|uniref:hypothetical protein n=1 Tax=Clostridium sp. DSM 100503 TaxID=2963282 RepID=UPI002149F672|nr:hypothetical protein [Clostridium sp. DSM 100503]MCR1949522.1 hypothetical protein [Clostridium sp. DSM 100503]